MVAKFTKPSRLWMPPKSLRALPGDFITKDHGDPTRIHPNDAPAIRRGLLRSQIAGGKGPFEAPMIPERAKGGNPRQRLIARIRELETHYGPQVPLTQPNVDLVRARILLSKLGGQEGVEHVWFPHPTLRVQELRAGPAPRNPDRPPHLFNLSLEIDLLDWSPRICDIMQEIGINAEETLSAIRARARAVARKAGETSSDGCQKSRLD